MPRVARRYDVFFPLNFNDGRLVSDERFDSVERRLLARFGGLTTQMREFPLRGMWQGDARLYLDRVIVMTALDFRPRGSTRFIADLKRNLLQEFDQLEILITESSLRVHCILKENRRPPPALPIRRFRRENGSFLHFPFQIVIIRRRH